MHHAAFALLRAERAENAEFFNTEIAEIAGAARASVRFATTACRVDLDREDVVITIASTF
jgi:hypothetical protein